MVGSRGSAPTRYRGTGTSLSGRACCVLGGDIVHDLAPAYFLATGGPQLWEILDLPWTRESAEQRDGRNERIDPPSMMYAQPFHEVANADEAVRKAQRSSKPGRDQRHLFLIFVATSHGTRTMRPPPELL